jgi:hypothetical protein
MRARAGPDRRTLGTDLLFFRRAFGVRQKPVDGVPLYRKSSGSLVSEDIPDALRVDLEPGDLERQIWTRFWTYANDPAQAAGAGIRVAQGEAVHTRAVRGQVYKVTLTAAQGLSLEPRLPAAMVGEVHTPDSEALPRVLDLAGGGDAGVFWVPVKGGFPD